MYVQIFQESAAKLNQELSGSGPISLSPQEMAQKAPVDLGATPNT